MVEEAAVHPWEPTLGLVAVDTETGGLDCATDALLSVGVFAMLPGNVPFRRVVYLFPGDGLYVEAAATAKNGFSFDKWKSLGAVEECVGVLRVLQVLLQLRGAFGRKLQVVAHNAGFDRGFLAAAFSRYGVVDALEGDYGVTSRRWECSCATFGAVRRAGILPGGACSLDDLTAGRTGTPMDVVKEQRGTHVADVDAEECWRGYQWLLGLMRQGAPRNA